MGIDVYSLFYTYDTKWLKLYWVLGLFARKQKTKRIMTVKRTKNTCIKNCRTSVSPNAAHLEFFSYLNKPLFDHIKLCNSTHKCYGLTYHFVLLKAFDLAAIDVKWWLQDAMIFLMTSSDLKLTANIQWDFSKLGISSDYKKALMSNIFGPLRLISSCLGREKDDFTWNHAPSIKCY